MAPTLAGAPVCQAFWIGGSTRLATARGQVDVSLSPSLRLSPGRFGGKHGVAELGLNFIQNPRLGDSDAGYLKNWGTEQSIVALEGDGPLEQSHFLRVVTSVEHSQEGCVYGLAGQLPVTTGVPHTGSVYVRGSGTVRLRMIFNAGGGGAAGADYILTGAWKRLTITATPAADTTALLSVEAASAQVATIETGAWQFEASPHATAYLDGSMGSGFSWLGAADVFRSQRQAGRISLPSQIISLVRGGIAFWWRPDHGYDFTRDRVLLHIPTGGAPLQLRHVVATNRFRLSSPAGDAAEIDAPSFAIGEDLLLSAGWTREGLVAGAGEVTVQAGRSPGPWAATGRMDLGSTGEATPASGLHAEGAIGPAWWFDGPPTTDVLRVLARAATLPRLAVA